MRKKFFGILLMSAMMIALPVGAAASQIEDTTEIMDIADEEAENAADNDSNAADKGWTLGENGVLTIALSGRLSITDETEWQDLRQEVTELHLEEGITAIEDGVFANFAQLQSVSFPGSLAEIGKEAFYGCKSLNSLTISESVTRIGDHAFAETGLLSIIFQGEAPEFGDEVFEGVRNLHILYPSEFTSWSEELCDRVGNRRCRWIDNNCLGGFCGDAVEWEFENGTLTIFGEGDMTDFQIHCDEETFEIGCTSPWNDFANSVTTLVVEPGITSLGNLAFSQFDHLTSVDLPEGLASIGKNTFNGCISLAEISLPESLKILNEFAFSNCGALERIYWPEGLVQVEDNAFKSCGSLKEICFLGTAEAWDLVEIKENGNSQLKSANILVEWTEDSQLSEEMEEPATEEN